MGKRILIVDDSMRFRIELRDLLLTSGFSVVGIASDGQKAIELYKEREPDLVMVDARMPQMDGCTVIREIRRINPDALTVICAGAGERSSVNEAMSAGAIDFCTKPYVQRSVVNVVRQVLLGIRRVA